MIRFAWSPLSEVQQMGLGIVYDYHAASLLILTPFGLLRVYR